MSGAAAVTPGELEAAPGPAPTGVDLRLLRLTQRQGIQARRGPTEAVVVQRRRQRSPDADEGAAATQQLHSGPHAHADAALPGELGDGQQEDQEQDDEAIAARRMAIRARQIAAAAETAALPSDEEEVSSC